MSEEERVKLAGERRAVFANLAKGVPVPAVMAAFHLSEKEVLDHFHAVARRVEEYRHRRGQPYANCKTIRAAVENAAIVLLTLTKIGPMTLIADPKLSVIETSPFKIRADGRMSEAEQRLLEIRTRSRG